ncbi:hypothetical protein H6P81_004951 [Aristolochia fimbriata]|uniref:C2 domain-containing protein n=1 Tax=Aristolochia fimbriata TaxID=158543 RepID=A0AAV7ET72_ARIFI|nr:hypothetical protein H6P81_004951 [Aristolochia fimbriata]
MSETSGRKLIVDVCNARNLMPKDGQGTASAYVLVDFDGQRRRTKTKFRDLNPQWDEKLEFLVHDPDSMASETLELNVYNDKKTGKRSTFLGKVKISGGSFSKLGSETLVYYPLEKRSVFSQIKGEIGLKVCFIDEGSPAPENPKSEAPPAGDAAAEGKESKEEDKKEEKTEEKKEDAKEEKKEESESKPTETKEEGKSPEDQKPAEAAAPPESAPNPEKPTEKPPASDAGEAKHPKEKPPTMTKTGPDAALNDVELKSISERAGTSYDLVERMLYLYVRVLKAKRSDAEANTGTDSSVYAKLVIGTHSVCTKTVRAADWDQVFAFHKEDLNSTALEVSVWTEKKAAETGTDTPPPATDKCMGTVSFDLQEVPKRVPPDSPLAPQWYTLEGSPENSPGTDVMLAVWVGTQADESFQEAWQSDTGGLLPETRAKAYLSPKLWYLRLTVIQTQDLQLGSGAESKAREFFVKAQLGPQVFKTAKCLVSSSGSSNPCWDEDLIFVAAEPFEPFLSVGVEDVTAGKSVGQTRIQVATIDRRTDNRTEPRSRWFNLVGDETRPYAGRIHVRVCLEGGYHVLDEAAHVTSDVRAASKQLSKPPIGTLEVGIRGATNLLPMKTKDGTRGTTDAYVVAKYGPKWFRTRTLLDRFGPRWNEQYTWDVYDPCTVLTIGVFDNGRYKKDESGKPGKDVRMGKIRVRLSTLDTNRVYLNSYSLTVLHPGGAKKLGEIELAVRFTSHSWLSLIQAYATPVLPRMHYVRPLGPAQQDVLRHAAMRIVTARLARSEPPVGQEVVQYMLDTEAHVWSMRRSKANWFRVVGCLSRAVSFARWLDGVRTWAQPWTTMLVHALVVVVVVCPHLILSTAFLYAFFVVAWRYRYRRGTAVGGADARLSCVEGVGPDELDEEFDGFPSGRGAEQVRARYDRLRALAGRAQTLLGDVAAQGERVEALMNWRDPRATGIFVAFCLLASLVLYAVPFRVLILGFGFYHLRHPRFRDDMPSVPANFFRRLPSLAERIL